MSKLTVRRAIIIVLAAASCLLVVPGMAGAQVRAKHRAEYKASLNDLKNVFKIYAQGYDNAKAASDELAITMMATTDHDLLVRHEQQALSVYTAYLGKPAEWNTSYAKIVNACRGKASRYFAAIKQQARFKTACNRLQGLRRHADPARQRARLRLVPGTQHRPAGLPEPRGVARLSGMRTPPPATRASTSRWRR